MHRIRTLALLLVTLAMVTSVPVAGLAVGGDAGQTDRVDQRAGEEPALQGQAQDQRGCNYVSLYNETIPSIVQIQLAEGLGSGFVYETSENASYVVTNEHVVSGNESVGIRDSNGDLHDGSEIGRAHV